jgi:hypothetical protein
MGLVITAYSKVRFQRVAGDDEDCDWDTTTIVFINQYFPDVQTGLVNQGIYEYDEKLECWFSSYSYYGAFRRRLEEILHENDLDGYFDAIIKFSDCEGTLDTETCRLLATRFRKLWPVMQAALKPQRNDDLYPTENDVLYKNLMDGLELAAQGGFLRFH